MAYAASDYSTFKPLHLLTLCKAFYHPTHEIMYRDKYRDLSYQGYFSFGFLHHGLIKPTGFVYTEELMVVNHSACRPTVYHPPISFPNLKSLTLVLLDDRWCLHCPVIRGASPSDKLKIAIEQRTFPNTPAVADLILSCSSRVPVIKFEVGSAAALELIPRILSFPRGPNVRNMTFRVPLRGGFFCDEFRQACQSFISTLKSLPHGETLIICVEFQRDSDIPREFLGRLWEEIEDYQSIWHEESVDVRDNIKACVSLINSVPDPDGLDSDEEGSDENIEEEGSDESSEEDGSDENSDENSDEHSDEAPSDTSSD